MKNLKRIVSGTLLVGVLVATGVTAFAAVGSNPSQEALNRQTQVQERQHNTEFERGYSRPEGEYFRPNEVNEDFTRGHRKSRRGHMNSGWGHRNTGGHHRNFDNGQRPELTDEQRAIRTEEMKVRLSEALAAGNISQEEYNRIMEEINSGLRPRFLGNGHHRSEEFGHRGNCHFGYENSTSQTPNQPAAIK